MNILVSLLFGIVCIVVSIFLWIKYDAMTITQVKKSKKWKCAILFYILFTIVIFLYVGMKEYPWIILLKLAMAYLLIASVALIDFRFHIIPNKIILGMSIARLLLAVVEFVLNREEFQWTLLGAIVGAIVGFGVLFLTNIFSKNGIGMGDAKLFGVLGFILGLSGTYNTLFYSLIFLVVYSGINIAKKKLNRKSQVPFGPFVYIGYLVTFCLGAI